MGIIACYSQCWGCMFGQHYDPPRMHGWADEEDYEHAERHGFAKPDGPCACYCTSHQRWREANGRKHPLLSRMRAAYRRRQR